MTVISQGAGSMAESSRLREALLHAVDDGLLAPGEIVRKAIYEHLDSAHHVERDEIPEKLEAFHKALEESLGKAGYVLERLIAKNLYNQLGLSFRGYANWSLIDYVDDVKKRIAGGLL